MSFSLLPFEMIEKIFRHLDDLNEMLKCRRLNKRCRQAVDGIRIDSLSVQNLERNDIADKDFVEPKSVYFRARKLHFFKFKIMKRMLSKLKQLAICFLSFNKKQIFQGFQKNINQLAGLEHLLIKGLYLGNEWTLQLDHIKSLTVLRISGDIVLEAPKLTKLAITKSYFSFKIANTKSIVDLTLDGIGSLRISGYSKRKIEYLRFQTNPPLRDLNKFISTHSALRELHIQLVNRETASNLIKRKRTSRNLNLTIYIAGFPIEDLADVEQLFGNQPVLKNVELSYILENFERIRSANWIKRVSYSELVGYSDRPPVDAFLSKFDRIEQVEVGWRIESETKFAEFLKRCKMLKKLIITNSPLSDAFYENLHTSCAELEVLKIETTHQFPNLDFLLKHRRLRELTINKELDLEFINRLMQAGPSDFYLLRFQRKGIWVELSQARNVWNFKFKSCTFTCCSVDQSTPIDFLVALKSLFDFDFKLNGL